MDTKHKAILLGITSALFFAATFVLNRSMSLEGGSWIWSASLRYFWMALLLFPLLLARGELRALLREMSKNKLAWLGWSTIGFGIFYGGLTYASSFAPGWLVAGTWQLTIIAGLGLSPLLNRSDRSVSRNTILFSLIIVLGVFILQIPLAKSVSTDDLLKSVLPVLVAAVAYPLGNRKMMQITEGRLTATQRLLGMTLASLPCWIALAVVEGCYNGLPDGNQLLQTFMVAVTSGVIATSLFFRATDLVREDERGLAAVEATQSTEVAFALAGEVLFLHAPFPGALSLLGIAVISVGMVLHSTGRAGTKRSDD
ncbi:MAG TPA: multidrug resistance efflux transporter family protein [Sphingobacterium sp.]|jgi:drug/metabolite transporter (DMT)-like permease|nr:multidrug resistance efflux transporter family protein [Sphingobacterium sp.]